MTQTKNNDSMFRAIENAIEDEAIRLYGTGRVDEETLSRLAEDGVEKVLADQPSTLALELKKRAKSMLKDRRSTEKAFRKRNFKRWKPAFDQIETVWHAAEEIGRNFNREYRGEAAANSDFVFEVGTIMHGRGLLVAKETIHNLKGGFPDGALSRWRTLHEIFVTLTFIKNHGQAAAERYLASIEFTRAKAAKQLNQYAERANLEKFSNDDMEEIERRRDEMEAKYGKEMRGEYGWARPAFPHFADKQKVRFSDIEENTGLDHWRPRYKWSSQHTHAGMRDMNALLGQSEATEPMILVGESNSGFVDPLQMTALHISSLTALLLLMRPNIDAVIMAGSINLLAEEVAEIAIETEKRTFAQARRKKGGWFAIVQNILSRKT